MHRVSIAPRPDWVAKMEALGFDFHTIPHEADPEGLYWDESAYWQFTEAEIDCLDDAATELHKMCLDAADRIVRERLYPLLNIPDHAIPAIEASWQRAKAEQEFSLYGRFDLAFRGQDQGDGMPKLLEYNADTPTGLLEASVAQWAWLEERFPDGDQFNAIHEGLVEQWGKLSRIDRRLLTPEARGLGGAGHVENGCLHLTCLMPHREDEGTLRYLQETAIEAGFATKMINLADIGLADERGPWNGGQSRRFFVDLDDQPIAALFKLTPWEWLAQDDFGRPLLEMVVANAMRVVEPAWKMLLSNKGLLAVLWEMYPYHPYLLEAHFDRRQFSIPGKVVAKPLLGREGANIRLLALDGQGGVVQEETGAAAGPYGAEGYVYQAWSPVASARAPNAKGQIVDHHAVIGAWMIDGACRGIGIREDATAITRDTSRFVPHLFV
jgi:glutathionylspermidine synthase